MTAGPSYTFISDPVVVIRPSGKMMHDDPRSTARIMVRIDRGLVGSIGSALTNIKNGFAHHFLAMDVSTAKMGSPGRNAPSRSPSRNEAWFAAMTAFGNAPRTCSTP